MTQNIEAFLVLIIGFIMGYFISMMVFYLFEYIIYKIKNK